MLKIRTTITYTGLGAMKGRDLTEAAREELPLLGLWWHQKILPRHFTPRAFSLYSGTYRPRGFKYTRRKGHNRPMVGGGKGHRTPGALRAALLGFSAIRASAKTVRISMTGTRALNLSGRKNYPDMRAEITDTSQDERMEAARRLDRGVAERIKRINRTRTVNSG